VTPEPPRKGLWGRVKGVLGVSDDEGEGERVPTHQAGVGGTFTASRLPPADSSPLATHLFPEGSQGKWELYEDGWSQIDAVKRERAEQAWHEAEFDAEFDAEDGSEDLSQALEALADRTDASEVLAHLDADEVDALARAVGFQDEPAPEPAPEPTPQPTPEPRIEVHERRLEQAHSRARTARQPAVHVHDERLDTRAPPQAMNPSEALALAQRGRRELGPRTDVGPAG